MKRAQEFSRLLSKTASLACWLALALATNESRADPADLTELPLESLLKIEVVSASKFSQKTNEAPSAVQIITAEEMHRHGWKTLTQALTSLPGIYAVNDRVYDYLGARGFLVPGDYNTRFLLLIDGQRNNDNIYQQAMFGNEDWLDMANVERIEYIPGAGSSIYGSNAMFGVVNIITRRATEKPLNEIGLSASELGERGIRVTTRRKLDETGLTLSYSHDEKSGRDQRYQIPAGAAGNLLVRPDGSIATDGIAHGLDRYTNERFFMKLDWDELSLSIISHERNNISSSALYLALFDDPSIKFTDGGTSINLALNHALSGNLDLSWLVGYTDWHYHGLYPYLDPLQGHYLSNEVANGQMINSDARLKLKTGQHQLIAGIEIQHDLLTRLQSYTTPAITGNQDFNTNDKKSQLSLYVQDEWRLTPAWLLNLGLRRDQPSSGAATISPRTGLIWHASEAWSFKLLGGRAYRNPNTYERLFTSNTAISNTNLKPESTRTLEGVAEWQASPAYRWQLSVYQNVMNNLISLVDTGGGVMQYQNNWNVRAKGFELGVENHREDGLMLRASLSGSHNTTSDGGWQSNSPTWQVKTSASQPVLNHKLIVSGELQSISRRAHDWGITRYSIPSQTLVNLTLTTPNLVKGLEGQLRISNLFDRSLDQPVNNGLLFPTIPQYGRTLSASLLYAF